MGVSENRGTLFWGPFHKDPPISGTTLGCPILGNSHIAAKHREGFIRETHVSESKAAGTLSLGVSGVGFSSLGLLACARRKKPTNFRLLTGTPSVFKGFKRQTGSNCQEGLRRAMLGSQRQLKS